MNKNKQHENGTKDIREYLDDGKKGCEHVDINEPGLGDRCVLCQSWKANRHLENKVIDDGQSNTQI